MKNTTRRTRMAVVPAVVAAFALSACQDSAPSAAPPTPASPTAQQSAAPTAQAPTETAAPTQAPTQAPSATEAPTQAPSSDGGGGDSAGVCKDTSSFSFTKGSIEAKPHDETQTGTYKGSDGKAEISFGKTKVDTAAGDSFFPGDGMQTVVVPVTIKMTSGSFFISSRLAFGLVDGQDNSCKSDVLNAVVPNGEDVPVESLKPGDSLTKKLGFAVPAGADLSKYSLIYASDYNSGKAELAWKAQ